MTQQIYLFQQTPRNKSSKKVCLAGPELARLQNGRQLFGFGGRFLARMFAELAGRGRPVWPAQFEAAEDIESIYIIGRDDCCVCVSSLKYDFFHRRGRRWKRQQRQLPVDANQINLSQVAYRVTSGWPARLA